MFGLPTSTFFLLAAIAAATMKPKDIPVMARTLGRLTGRAIANVQLFRSQFETVMQKSENTKLHKDMQDAMAQIEAIRYEMRSMSVLNPGPLTRRLVDNIDQVPASNGNVISQELDGDLMTQRLPDNISASNDNIGSQKLYGDKGATATGLKGFSSSTSNLSNLHSQATAYAKLAESAALKTNSMKSIDKADLSILPVSAESTGLLPNRPDTIKGSDIVLEAILEAEVAHNAKQFFAQPENQIKQE